MVWLTAWVLFSGLTGVRVNPALTRWRANYNVVVKEAEGDANRCRVCFLTRKVGVRVGVNP